LVAGVIVAQRMRQSALLFEIIVLPPLQLADCMLCEEVWRAAAAGQVPDRRLGTILAELEGMRVRRLGKGTGHAHEPTGLVLPPERVEDSGAIHLLDQDLCNAAQRAPAAF